MNKKVGVGFLAGVALIAAVAQLGSFPSVAFQLHNSHDSRKASTSILPSQARKETAPQFTDAMPVAAQSQGEHEELPVFITDLMKKKNKKAYTFDPTDQDYDEFNLSKLNIREWGWYVQEFDKIL